MRFALLTLSVVAVVALTGCNQEPETSASAPPAPAAEAVSAAPTQLDGLLLSAKPEAATTITAFKPSAQPGDNVVLRGRIGGRVQPFVTERASMIIADGEAIVACDAMADDHCSTPWDFCCEPKDKVMAATASVQVVDDNGQLIAANLDDLPGVDAGSHVVLTGTVADGSNADNLVINATGVFVE